MKKMKLEVDADVILHLEQMEKILGISEPRELKSYAGGEVCGGICKNTCSYYCRADCEAACQDYCDNTCKHQCGGVAAANCPSFQIWII